MPHVAAYGIEPTHLHAVIEGCQMDLEQTRYLDFPGLARYCHLVAGVVGEVAAQHLRPHAARRPSHYAHKLGLAMQLTNIIRDVGDDARRGRIYLPVNELQQFDVKAHEILKRALQRALHRADAVPGRARAPLLRRGAGAAARRPTARAQKPGLMMANIYRTLLREIEADDFQVLHQRISLTPLRKLWIAMRTNWRGR